LVKRQGTQLSQSRPSKSQAGATVMVALALTTVFAAAITGCHNQADLTPQQADGQHLYMERCAHCHEDNDLMLKPPPPNIHGAMRKSHLPSGAPATDAEVRRLVLAGKNKMPSFSGRFTEQQMAALLSYLHTDMPLTQPE
jgi:mono/diheme cytochrome c family protein